jgi:hypothetical protein
VCRQVEDPSLHGDSDLGHEEATSIPHKVDT